jgi:transcription elongation factor Elf1
MADTRLCPWDRQVMTASVIDNKTYYTCPVCGHMEYTAVLIDQTTVIDATVLKTTL